MMLKLQIKKTHRRRGLNDEAQQNPTLLISLNEAPLNSLGGNNESLTPSS